MTDVVLTLIGKPECHLCDVAESVVTEVIASLEGDVDAPRVSVEHRSILEDETLHELYWEQIPVLLVNGVKHAQWRVRPEKLRAAILGEG
ncbi:MAG TPA: glutaredoxin family protein [Terrimesophilobacter sp.]|nr:glutaredoxin family protein [Terrimesophilobacter sp.]